MAFAWMRHPLDVNCEKPRYVMAVITPQGAIVYSFIYSLPSTATTSRLLLRYSLFLFSSSTSPWARLFRHEIFGGPGILVNVMDENQTRYGCHTFTGYRGWSFSSLIDQFTCRYQCRLSLISPFRFEGFCSRVLSSLCCRSIYREEEQEDVC